MHAHPEFDSVLGKRAARGFAMSSDAINGSVGDSLRLDSTRPALADPHEIEEFPLQLTSDEVRALIDDARLQGLSAAGLARRLITGYLQRNWGGVQATTDSTGRT